MNTLRDHAQPRQPAAADTRPRFGGLFWRLSRASVRLTLPFAGKRWNPVFAVVVHQGRRTGRWHQAPVAARRVDGGFVISLAFGAQVDWQRNLQAAGRGTLRWRGRDYPIGAPVRIDEASGAATFHPIQRTLLRAVGIHGYVRVPDIAAVW